MWPRWVVDLSPRYGHLILVSRYLVLTGVNWSQHGCPISKTYTVNPGCMSLSTYYWEYGRHVVRLRRRHRRRRRAYAPTSNAASHDKQEKINSWVSFSFLWVWGSAWRPFRGRRSSAIKTSKVLYKIADTKIRLLDTELAVSLRNDSNVHGYLPFTQKIRKFRRDGLPLILSSEKKSWK